MGAVSTYVALDTMGVSQEKGAEGEGSPGSAVSTNSLKATQRKRSLRKGAWRLKEPLGVRKQHRALCVFRLVRPVPEP